ncbi:glycosyltransferase [Streptomyces sp. NPDC058623]|uniref:glycosyltransferase n=1 Tax=Streptomyces sp. NPDC058623 TaxID=3346563 RepID=UPI00364B4DAC
MRPTTADNPALRVLVATWGTAGDIGPYTGIAVALKAAGHRVTVVTSNRYAKSFTDHGIAVRAIPLDHFEERAGQAKPWLERVRNGQAISTEAASVMLGTAAEGQDILLTHPLLHPMAAVIAEALRLPCVGVYTVSHAMMVPRLMAALPWGRHSVADLTVRLLMSPMYAPALACLRRTLGMRVQRMQDLVGALRHEPVRYGISDALLPPRFTLPLGQSTTGHWPPARPPGWSPDQRLQDFLDSGPAPVYFGFGSMDGIDGDYLAHTIVRSAKKLRVRAVVQAGWAGIHAENDDILTIAECPHDWLFPRMRAAVHHAGPGTTHASLAAGTPTLPVPVGRDQPFWASRLTALGLAPVSLPVRQVTTAKLTHALQQTLLNEEYGHNTRRLQGRLRQQDGISRLVQDIATLVR